jgi:RNA polymerase sigma-70 factor, ECF subfamily
MTDKELIYFELLAVRCKRGDTGAIEELIHTFETRLFYYIRRLVNQEEDAWDVLQETWFKVIQGITKLREPKTLPAWLYRIARNTAISRVRKNIAERNMLADIDSELQPVNTEMEMANEISSFNAGRVHQALSRISLPHRDVLTLYFLEDLSLNEIAEIIEVPVGTIKSRVYHAKLALRKIIAQEDEHHEQTFSG